MITSFTKPSLWGLYVVSEFLINIKTYCGYLGTLQEAVEFEGALD